MVVVGVEVVEGVGGDPNVVGGHSRLTFEWSSRLLLHLWCMSSIRSPDFYRGPYAGGVTREKTDIRKIEVRPYNGVSLTYDRKVRVRCVKRTTEILCLLSKSSLRRCLNPYLLDDTQPLIEQGNETPEKTLSLYGSDTRRKK